MRMVIWTQSSDERNKHIFPTNQIKYFIFDWVEARLPDEENRNYIITSLSLFLIYY